MRAFLFAVMLLATPTVFGIDWNCTDQGGEYTLSSDISCDAADLVLNSGEGPLSITGTGGKITISGGTGALFRLNGGDLTLTDLEIEFAASNVTLFKIKKAATIIITNCYVHGADSGSVRSPRNGLFRYSCI